MSFRSFGRLLYNVGVQAIVRIFGRPKFQTLRPVVRAARDLQATRRFFGRLLNTTVRTKFAVRPFAALFHGHRDPAFRYSVERRERRLLRFRRQFQFFDQLKSLFGHNGHYNQTLVVDELPEGLDGYEIGHFIACGCNAAVYELKLNMGKKELSPRMRSLALKLMFNYDFALPERLLVEGMRSELIPVVNPPTSLQLGRFGRMKKEHPNVIKIHTAFVDRFPVLEGAEHLFPEALPTADMFGSLIHEPRTLCIVMKRYRMTLREYVLVHKRNYWTGRVMFGQLLEAIVFLFDQKIAHRDLKSDNVLLDFNSDAEIPHLVVSDFGSALTDTMVVKYVDEFTDLGGNLSLRPPEITRSSLTAGVLLDFSLADLWAAGTLGFEIFTRRNPFYSYLLSSVYDDNNDLPELPRRLPSLIKRLIARILRVNPTERPSPHVAANVVSLSLFRFGRDIRSVLEECGLNVEWATSKMATGDHSNGGRKFTEFLETKLDDLIGLFAAETISSRMISPTIISPSELQLRATFLSRLDRRDLWKSLEFLLDSAHELQSPMASNFTNSSADSTILPGG